MKLGENHACSESFKNFKINNFVHKENYILTKILCISLEAKHKDNELNSYSNLHRGNIPL